MILLIDYPPLFLKDPLLPFPQTSMPQVRLGEFEIPCSLFDAEGSPAAKPGEIVWDVSEEKKRAASAD
ncbi:MAG: hypothetical protein ISS70_26425 [Phycisphaerae bacterium]|nr:hypothetical protein [Phycisphaerae bacterium]